MTEQKQVLAIFGTRPEAIKMGPVVEALRNEPAVQVTTLATAQHRELLDDVLRVFGIVPDHDLDVMTENQSLAAVTARCVEGIDHILRNRPPALMVAQGDTTTVLAAALVAYYHRVPFAHVEAGLRTADKYAPFPEEINRRLVGSLADLHFAPTREAADHLLGEGTPPDRVHVTGNTVVDAVQAIAARTRGQAVLSAEVERFVAGVGRVVLVTAHRRESFGPPFTEMCRAMRDIVDCHPDVGLIYPVHPNPNVRRTVSAELVGRERILLLDPVDYLQFVHLMQRATLILTDSGGVQEEAPSLRKPVLVMREKTERPEGIRAGVARLVGTSRERIAEEAGRILDSDAVYQGMIAAENPYGDGRAAMRIVALIRDFLAI
jgi:UDP-N-acetylglucosamine 2-epimerase (non-hydrolysing)